MKLSDLLAGDARFDPRFSDLCVGGITADSRAVNPGDLFVAITGSRGDGLAFVADAVAAGAVAVVAERKPSALLPDHVAFVRVLDARRALALAAARLFSRQPAT